MSWAQILKRVFALMLLAAIEDPTVIVKTSAHLGWPTRAPPMGTAYLDAFMQSRQFNLLLGFRYKYR
ncbi:hypothetical protein [Candidatus Nitrospira salsa]